MAQNAFLFVVARLMMKCISIIRIYALQTSIRNNRQKLTDSTDNKALLLAKDQEIANCYATINSTLQIHYMYSSKSNNLDSLYSP